MNKKEIQELAQIIRGLSIDGVESANSGHPGLPLGMADVAAVLWTQFLKHNPKNPSWFDRDRFVLSAGHGSLLVYSLLHLFGYNLPLKELKRFRQWKSKTAGHPEYHETPGVETTTGPLGQGISNAVGMALAEKSLTSRFNTSRNKLVDHHTYVIASDGDLMEGVSHEASSFAGHNRLSKLIVLYDDNNISIDGETDLSFSENVIQRYKAYGWHTQKIDGHDLDAIKSAIEASHATDKPSLIACKTIIGYGSPNKAGTESVHGSPLGKVEARLTKEVLGLPVNKSFYVSPQMKKLKEKAKRQGVIAEKRWKERYRKYRLTYPSRAKLFEACLQKEVDETAMAIPTFEAGKIATRSASGKVLDYLANHVPALIGGSADLTPSNKTFPKGEKAFSKSEPQGRYVHYGVREHAMAAIMNGMALHGGVIPYGGTFFVFTDYMRPSIRLAALMGIQAIYVFTHDSIGLGEDGPTHQPIEHLASLRAMPNLVLLRPMDANETAEAWKIALQRRTGPTALVLTRQNLPIYDRRKEKMAAASNARKGGYVLVDDKGYKVILIASGSEVEIAIDAKKILNEQGIKVRIVSMPSTEIFDGQSKAYRDKVLGNNNTVRLAVEAGATLSWYKYIGSRGDIIGLDHYGASAPYQELYQQFGLTAKHVAARAVKLLKG